MSSATFWARMALSSWYGTPLVPSIQPAIDLIEKEMAGEAGLIASIYDIWACRQLRCLSIEQWYLFLCWYKALNIPSPHFWWLRQCYYCIKYSQDLVKWLDQVRNRLMTYWRLALFLCWVLYRTFKNLHWALAILHKYTFWLFPLLSYRSKDVKTNCGHSAGRCLNC